MARLPDEMYSPHLVVSEVSYDARWLGWDRSDAEILSDAERFGLVRKGNSLHTKEEVLRSVDGAMEAVEEPLERIILATYVRTTAPESSTVTDEELARALGISVYFVLALNAGQWVVQLKKSATEQRLYCSLRSLALGLGAYIKDHERSAELGAFAQVPESMPTCWEWADAAKLAGIRSKYAPKAAVVIGQP